MTTQVKEKQERDTSVAMSFSDIRAANEKNAELVERVTKQYPVGDQNITRELAKIIKTKELAGQTQSFKKREKAQTSGFIQHEDLIRWSKLQSELFPDYTLLTKIKENMKDEIQGKPPRNDIAKYRREMPQEEIYADNNLVPLSYSSVTDPKKTIVYEEKDPITQKATFIQVFENQYYEKCQEKKNYVKNKLQQVEEEKKKQIEKSQGATMGYFTSKIAKNASLFESRQYHKNETNCYWTSQSMN